MRDLIGWDKLRWNFNNAIVRHFRASAVLASNVDDKKWYCCGTV